jgi:hypothetical protein
MKRLAYLLILIPTSVIAAQLTLTWTDNSDNEDGFVIERSTNGTAFLPVNTVSSNVDTYVDLTLEPDTQYWYRVKAFNAAGDSGYTNVASATTNPELAPPTSPSGAGAEAPLVGELLNLSTRAQIVNVDGAEVIQGFVVGTAPITVLIRGIGPTIGNPPYNVAGALTDPKLTLTTLSGVVVAENDNWSGQDIANATAEVGAFAIPVGSDDSAILLTLDPGSYTAILDSVNGSTGVALFEIYKVP